MNANFFIFLRKILSLGNVLPKSVNGMQNYVDNFTFYCFDFHDFT